MAALSVLLIADDSAQVNRLADHLQSQGHTVVTTPLSSAGSTAGLATGSDAANVAAVVLPSPLPDAAPDRVAAVCTAHSLPVVVLAEAPNSDAARLAAATGASALLPLDLDPASVCGTLALTAARFAELREVRDQLQAEEERLANDERMQQMQKLESLGLLAGGIAHDFNNLLMGILGNADLSIKELAVTSPVRDMIEEIQQAAQSAAELCKQMLAYSGRGRFVIQSLSMNELLRSMEPLLDASVSKKVSLRFDLADELPPIQGDVAQLRQVILNLVTNASDAFGDGTGTITITTRTRMCDQSFFAQTYLAEERPQGNYVCLQVKDTGSGIDDENKNRIFDPFYSTKFTGRGLGLPAVLGIARGHDGAVHVESEAGMGSTFTVVFPVAPVPAQELPQKQLTAADWQGSGLVLVIDDEELVRSVTKRILEKMGFAVLTAKDGIAGMDVFGKYRNDIAVVLLDLTMPRMSGQETYRELRALSAETPVILSSGYDAMQAAERFNEEGLAGFIQKPYRARDLREKLREAIEGRTSA